MKPLLIEIDGPEYAGKTTTIDSLQPHLNKEFTIARTPGTSYLGTFLRPVVKQYKMIPSVACGVMMASMGDFYNHCKTQLGDKNIITDRGLCSSLIYQGYLNNCFEECKELYDASFKELQKLVDHFDYYRIILSITPDTVMKRKTGRDLVEFDSKDLFDNMDYKGHERLCNYYKSLKDKKFDEYLSPDRTYIIECDDLTQEGVIKAVSDIINQLN